MKQPVIQFQDFTFQYESQSEPTLKDINLTIYAGEKVAIVGPSGSGKSTLVHCLNGLIPFAYKGEIIGSLRIGERETKDLDIFTISKSVGTVMQDTDGQFIGMSVAEDIAFTLENEGIPLPQIRDRVQKAAHLVHMSSFLNTRIHELSGGQKQRVALAGVLVNEVEIVLFDEPLANLDPATGKEAMTLIDGLQKSANKTVIIIEHRLEEVLSESLDRIILVNHGQIIADTTPNEILASRLLTEHSIREPLYLKLLKYADCKLSASMNLSQLNELPVSQFASKIKDWTTNMVTTVERLDETSPVLELNQISFNYPGKTATIHNLSLTLNKGEMVSLIGANGAGKSTLSALICGFEKPTSGSITFNGQDALKDTIRERAERVGFVLQNPNHMFSKLRVFEEVAFGLEQKNTSEEIIKVQVEETLKVCGLYPLRNWPISALSYGQKKRLSIAVILVMEPAILILDEPTAGQDYKHTTELMTFLERLQARGITILLITHDMHLMTEYSNRAIVLAEGSIIADSTPAEVLTNPELLQKANLRESSLYTLAKKLHITEPAHFVQQFIQMDREVRAHEHRADRLS